MKREKRTADEKLTPIQKREVRKSLFGKELLKVTEAKKTMNNVVTVEKNK